MAATLTQSYRSDVTTVHDYHPSAYGVQSKPISGTGKTLKGQSDAPVHVIRPVEPSKGKPVEDDFMYELKGRATLPTLSLLRTTVDADDPEKVAQDWLSQLSEACSDSDGDAWSDLFWDEGVWRDKVVFTFEYRSFNGKEKIRKAARDLLPLVKAGNFSLIAPGAKFEKPYDDLHYVSAHFSFDTEIAGASGVVNLVKTEAGYRAWTLHTVIESLHGFPELPNRDGHMVGPHSWSTQREIDIAFEDREPEVLVVGGGHNGLMMAARLQALGVSTLLVERNERIGDNWRKRYEALSLHFPHWADHLPYMPYPEHWPVFTPATKLGNWLEYYSDAMELHCWTSSEIVACEQDSKTNEWTVTIERGGQGTRVVRPKHVVMATSLAGVPFMPNIRGMDNFNGTVRHSTCHDSSREWVGKKVLVVGTSSSGLDTAYDFARRGIDVTLLQRSPTYVMSLHNSVPKILGHYKPGSNTAPIEVNDRISYAMPVAPGEELGRRFAKQLAEEDKDLIDGMEKAGFRTYLGQRETGVQTLGYTRNGGFYFDAGACAKIIDGSIKVEHGSIDHFMDDKVVLNGGREKDYDLVIMATGFSNTIDSVQRTLGSTVADRCKPIWGIDSEGELNSAYRGTGVPHFWLMVGTLQHGRYHSKRLSLRIKAMLEGIAQDPYET